MCCLGAAIILGGEEVGVVGEGIGTPLLLARPFLVDWEEAVLVLTGLEMEERVLPILGLVVVGGGVPPLGLEEMVGLDWWSYHTLYRLLNRIQ